MNVQMSYNFTRILPKIGSSTSEKKNISTSKMTLIQQQNASIDGPGFLSLPIDTRASNGYEPSSRWSRHLVMVGFLQKKSKILYFKVKIVKKI